MLQERRKHRSNCRGKALDLSLCAAARGAHVAGVVLADARGLLIASNLKGPAAEMLAAAGAALAYSGRVPEFCGPRLPSRIVARRVSCEHEMLCLCAAGDPRDGRIAVRLASISVRRILHSSLMRD